DGSQLRASENAHDPIGRGRQGGCDSIKGTTVAAIDSNGNQNHYVFPCFNRKSIMGLMNDRRVSWSYYQQHSGSGQWHGVDAVRGIWNSPSYKNVKWPSSRFLRDIAAGRFDQVTFITPSPAESDHPGINRGRGPAWVTSVVNAIGHSAYWKDTAIFVVWDDWGGWYDHVAPSVYNSYELGFRVPLIVIGPYAKAGYISTKQHEFGSILKFTEEVFNLGSLGTTDVRSDDLSDCFNFSQQPHAFRTIAASPGARYFLNAPPETGDVDDDF
ncbi:MAG TPA: alkaline phosphatase family protein, partial [Candidatus Nitrosotalea sp.]|nr:alkaline phosphatase family protein [Candidatus Nitrosotalea sp.]